MLMLFFRSPFQRLLCLSQREHISIVAPRENLSLNFQSFHRTAAVYPIRGLSFSSTAEHSPPLDLEEGEDHESVIHSREQTLLKILQTDQRNHLYPPLAALPKISHTISQVRTIFSHLRAGEKMEDTVVTVAGRISSIRTLGSKMMFVDLIGGVEAEPSHIQIVISAQSYSTNVADSDDFALKWDQASQILRRGDIICVAGTGRTTKRGELSIDANKLHLLSPCLNNTPLRLKNHEIRYRKRHLDFIVDSIQPPITVDQSRIVDAKEETKTHVDVRFHARKVFFLRAKIIRFIRQYLEEREYLEVETPILSTRSGGANAVPFTTQLRSMDPSDPNGKTSLYLRIAPELYLKQLVIGGIERVYELGKQFRNEGFDHNHNPEFTTCELYQAYADCESYMTMTEDLLSKLVFSLFNSFKVKLANGEELDFTPPFKRLHIMQELEVEVGRVLPDPNNPSTFDEWFDILHSVSPRKSQKVDSRGKTNAKVIDELIGHFLEPKCFNPTFLIGHPLCLSPLSKEHHSFPGIADRFELFIKGQEVCNAYTELNDPREQRKRFQSQLEDHSNGDEESQPMDEPYCRALQYGLPPTAGAGFGIDRLTMLLSSSAHIRDVLLFPMMKPRNDTKYE